MRITALCLSLLLSLATAAVAADAPSPRVADAHVDEALAAAADNRAELERALAHFDVSDDTEKRTAIRFLVANMPGKGHVVTRLRDAEGDTVAFDPLAYPTFAESRAAIEALEKEHGELAWDRERLVEDCRTITAEFLIAHVEAAFEVWRASPPDRRPGFDAFLNHVLPYRGSEEPLADWIGPLRARYADLPEDATDDVRALYAYVNRDVGSIVKFNERYYLHPTDQGYAEMLASGQGRCEDITNMQTYAARAVGLATAADYTPAWAHRDNNHAWNVLLDQDGVGCNKAQSHAAKIYRKSFALQRGNLAYLLPAGREAPNRFLASRSYRDVTDQYMATTDVTVDLDPAVVGDERFAYICVFNGGDWTAIHWAPIESGRATFTSMGRNIVYLPAVHDGERLLPAAPPLLLHHNGALETLRPGAATSDLVATSVRPRQKSPDTLAETPVSHLTEGTEYTLSVWREHGWHDVDHFIASADPRRLPALAAGALYWLVAADSRRLERPFTIASGAQRFW